MTRPSFEDIYMNMAGLVALRSTCRRLHVGTVITTDDFRKVISIGYNGNASGCPNDCDSDIPGSCGCVHSEANAIINCDAPRTLPKVVFCTHLPCKMCAKLLINLGGVSQVYFYQPYRSLDSVNLLKSAGIPLIQTMRAIPVTTHQEHIVREYEVEKKP